jgi:hypothetical protein
MKKTSQINLMVEPEIKKRLIEKAKALNLTLTAYVEKIAQEPVCFLDSNVRTILESLKLKV